MNESKQPAPFFVADHPALDFLNSIAAPWGSEIEWLSDGAALLDWFEAAGLVPVSVVEKFRAKSMSKELNAVTLQARELREWFRQFVVEFAGQPLDRLHIDELDYLNRILRDDSCFYQIEATHVHRQGSELEESGLDWRQQRQWSSPVSLLLPIAQSMGDLICHHDFTLVKNCEGPTCTLWFYDVSKNHGRRWCSMSVCGNRAKAAAHRAKKKARQIE